MNQPNIPSQPQPEIPPRHHLPHWVSILIIIIVALFVIGVVGYAAYQYFVPKTIILIDGRSENVSKLDIQLPIDSNEAFLIAQEFCNLELRRNFSRFPYGEPEEVYDNWLIPITIVNCPCYVMVRKDNGDTKCFVDRTEPDPFANWPTYRNEEYGFEVKYPGTLMTIVYGEDSVLLRPHGWQDNWFELVIYGDKTLEELKQEIIKCVNCKCSIENAVYHKLDSIQIICEIGTGVEVVKHILFLNKGKLFYLEAPLKSYFKEFAKITPLLFDNFRFID